MKTHLALLSAGLFAAAHATHAAGPTIPQRPPADAFQKLTEDWPFALATPVVAAAEPVKGWASNYYVGGIMKNYESGKEEFVVAVKSKDGRRRFPCPATSPMRTTFPLVNRIVGKNFGEPGNFEKGQRVRADQVR